MNLTKKQAIRKMKSIERILNEINSSLFDVSLTESCLILSTKIDVEENLKQLEKSMKEDALGGSYGRQLWGINPDTTIHSIELP